MTFYANPCSLQFLTTDSSIQFYRKFLSFIIIFQIVIVILLRFVSVLKNHDLKHIKKQIEQKQKIQQMAIMQTMQNLNNQTLKGNSDSIFKNIIVSDKTSKTKIKDKKRPLIENKGIIKNEIDQNHQNDDQHDSQGEQEQYEEKTMMEIFLEKTEENKRFINFYGLKLSYSQAVTVFTIPIGHFFISVMLSIHFSPSLTSLFMGISHIILFITLLIISMCHSPNKTSPQPQQSSLNQSKFPLGHNKNFTNNTINLNNSSNINVLNGPQGFEQTMHMKEHENGHKEGQERFSNKRPLRQKISIGIMALMLFLNVCLIAMSVIQMKKSHFNWITNTCNRNQ